MMKSKLLTRIVKNIISSNDFQILEILKFKILLKYRANFEIKNLKQIIEFKVC